MTEQKAHWVTAKPEEIKTIIIDLAKQGMSPEKIGLILRDQHSIPRSKLLGIRVKQVLQEAKVWVDSNQTTLEKKVDTLNKHVGKHKHDYSAKKSLLKNAASLRKNKR